MTMTTNTLHVLRDLLSMKSLGANPEKRFDAV
jgi:hypothetical protein